MSVDDGKISGESLVKGVKGDDVAGADFRFELSLACAEETFYQAAGSGVVWRSVPEFDDKAVTGRTESVGNVDLGIIEVEFFWRAVNSPCPDERINNGIKGLFEVVPSLDDVTAMAVNEEAKVGRKRFTVNKDIGAFLKITQPEVVGVVAGPAYTHLLL